jgi:hypothetical protein
VVGAALYAPRPAGRSAYADQSLAAAIRDGLDPDGRELSPLMPRYAMAPDELSQLIDYLKQLAARPSPGVSGGTVHLATVVTEDVPASRRQAMVDVMERYLRDLNDAADARPAADRGPHWRLHLWTLSGTAQGRRTQLQAYFAQQPVFALVGGLTTDTWLPVHEFCQVERVPCLFPNTRLPVSGAPAFYALYFDRGSVLKAQILARYFADHPAQCPTGRILQVLPRDWSGQEPAAALRQSMGRARSHRVVDLVVEPGAATPPQFWREALGRQEVCALVLWSDSPDLAADLAGLAALSGELTLPPVFLSDDPYTGKPPSFDPRLGERLRFITTLDPAAAAGNPAMDAWSEWMRSHQLALSEPLLQANTWFVMSLVDEAVRANAGDFTPEHLIERIEYSVGSVVPHPMLRSAGLGMGQRFAAKGGYILRPGGDGPGSVAALTELVVP